MDHKHQERKKPEQGERVVYEIKVTLKGIRPSIWRRIQTTGDTLLWGLHSILQAVMGWAEEHPHRFLIGGTCYDEAGVPSVLEVVDEESARLSDVICTEGEKFLCEYGAGNGWNHEVLIEKILTGKRGQRYPFCLDGERACPPEHCTTPRVKISVLLHAQCHPGFRLYD